MGALGVSCYQLDPADRSGWVEAVLIAMDLRLEPPQIDHRLSYSDSIGRLNTIACNFLIVSR